MMRRRVWAMVIPVVLFATGSVIHAHLAGPPPGYSGAPGDESCGVAGCHTPPPTPSIPRLYVSTEPLGQDTVAIAVTVVGDGSQGSLPYGFQATVLDTTGQPIGEIILVDPARTQSDTGSNGRIYVSHTVQGVTGDICSNCERWKFHWIRPDPPVSWVIVYAAGCAGDGDSSEAGDLAFVGAKSIGAAGGGCLVVLTGDVNVTGSVTSADIIYLIGFVFKGRAGPLPCEAAGDVNCDGVVTSADIITLVNFVFRSGRPPCNVCELVPDVWDCE